MKRRHILPWLLVFAAVALPALPAAATEEPTPEPHTHNVTAWTPNETGHSGSCADCGETVTEEHSYGEGSITTAPTCQAEGVKTFTCICGHSYEETIEKFPDHVCDVWTAEDTHHTGSCIHCSETLTAEHNYDAGIVTQEPSCNVEGSKLYTCAICDYTKTESLAASGHSMDDGVITEAPTCQAEGKKVYTCSVCGVVEEESLPRLSDHICNEWTAEDTRHIGVCIHCGETLYRDHNYENILVTEQPTCQAEGKQVLSCVCGHSYEQTVPVLPDHVGGNWTLNETGHTGTCIHCQAPVVGDHTYDDDVIIVAPTCQAEGKMLFTCVCGHSYEQTVPVLPDHVGGNWTLNETGHTGTCIHCQAPVVGDHTYDDGVIIVAPTCQTEGSMRFTCICGHSYEQTVPVLEEHVVENWTIAESGHTGACIHCNTEVTREHRYDEGTVTLEPTCTADGSKLLTCIDCGHTVQEVIPSPGHLYSDWEDVDETYHKHTCVCGKTEKKNHKWDKGEITREPSCSAMGIKTYTCTDCGRTKDTTTYLLQHIYYNNCDISCNVCGHIRRPQHSFGTKWYSDADTHWQVCTVCRTTGDPEPHTASDWIVDEAPGEYTEGQQHIECSVCAKVLQNASIPATGCLHGNEELRNVKEATCLEDGYTGDLTCPRCEEIVTAGEAIPALPHETAVEGQKAPSCTEEGYSGDHICQICRTTVTPGEAIPVLPHETAIEGQTAPSCTEEGYSGDHICQICRTTVTPGEAIPVLPHETAIEGQTAPSCTEEGYSGDHICQICRTIVTPGEAIPALPHETQLQNAQNESCTADGYTGDQVCLHCAQTIEKGQVIPASGHSYTDGSCSSCGAQDPDFVAPTTPSHPTEPGTQPQSQPEPTSISPMVIIAMVMLAVTGIGIVVMIVLLAKKK